MRVRLIKAVEQACVKLQLREPHKLLLASILLLPEVAIRLCVVRNLYAIQHTEVQMYAILLQQITALPPQVAMLLRVLLLLHLFVQTLLTE